MEGHVLRVRRCARRVAGVDGGRVMASGVGWAWLITGRGAVHLTRGGDADGPLSIRVAALGDLPAGSEVRLDHTQATLDAEPAAVTPGRRPDVLAVCDEVAPHAWADDAARALGAVPLGDVLPRLIGRGGGLTPEGDDAICGYLSALAAAAPDAFARDAPLVAAHLDRTGEPSRSLLAAAAQDGATFRAALVLRGVLVAADRRALAPALRRTVGVGRSTGRAVLAGMCRGLATGGGAG